MRDSDHLTLADSLRKVVSPALLAIAAGILSIACGPLPRSGSSEPAVPVARITKSDLPPVLPPGSPPGPTTVLPAQPSYLLAGRISGITVQGVEATTPSGTRRYRASMAPNQEFAFAYLLPDNYVLEIQTGLKRLLIQRLVTIWPERALFLEIKIDPSLASATVDDLPFAIRPLTEVATGPATADQTPGPDPS